MAEVANEGRFLNKRFVKAEGVIANDGQFIAAESGWVLGGGVAIGDGGTKLSKVIASSTTVTLNHGSTVGSLAYGINVTVLGVTPGDLILAAPVASLPLGVLWSAACYSANVVNIRSLSTGSWATGDIAGTTWRIVALRF